MTLSSIQHLTPVTQVVGSAVATTLESKPLKGGPLNAFLQGVGLTAAPIATVGAVCGDAIAAPLRLVAGTSVTGRRLAQPEHFLERGALGWASDRMEGVGSTSGRIIGRGVGHIRQAIAWCVRSSAEGYADRAAAEGSRIGARVGAGACTVTDWLGAGLSFGAHTLSVIVGFLAVTAAVAGVKGLILLGGLAMLLHYCMSATPRSFVDNWCSDAPPHYQGV